MKKLLIIAAALLALPDAAWIQAYKTPIAFAQAGPKGTIVELTINYNALDFGSTGPGTTVNNEANPVILTVKTDYNVVWYLQIHDVAPLTKAVTLTTIPNTNYFHRSIGGAGVHADADYTAMTTVAATFYTADPSEYNNIPDGTTITSYLQVVVPNTQAQGAYTNVTTYTATVVE